MHRLRWFDSSYLDSLYNKRESGTPTEENVIGVMPVIILFYYEYELTYEITSGDMCAFASMCLIVETFSSIYL